MRNRALLLGSTVAFLLGSIAAGAQQPEIVNARLDQASASAGLSAAITAATGRDSAPSWVGYSVPEAPTWKKARTTPREKGKTLSQQIGVF